MNNAIKIIVIIIAVLKAGVEILENCRVSRA